MRDRNRLTDNDITRREFIAGASVALTGLALNGVDSDALTDAPVRIGHGYHTYELVRGWGELPPNKKYGWGCGIVADSKDRIYIHSRSAQAVCVFDRHGTLLRTWGAEFAATGHGLYRRQEGCDESLYFTDHPRNLVVKTDLDGNVLMRLGDVSTESAKAIKFSKFDQPTDLAIAPNGDLYVCEGYGGNVVHQFTRQGEYIRTIGSPGSGPGQFQCPHGIWVDTRKPEPELYIADRNNQRIQVLTLDGQFKRSLPDNVRHPCGFYAFKGKMYIPDLDHRVTILDERDQICAHLGDGRSGVTDATFDAPHAVTVDSHGDLYVIEWRADARVRKFRHVPETRV